MVLKLVPTRVLCLLLLTTVFANLIGFQVFSPKFAFGAENKLTLAHMFAKGSLPDLIARKFAVLVAEKSENQMKIEIFPEGYFGDERKNLLLLQDGKLDLAVTGDLFISFLDEKFLVINMPFIYRDADHALAVYNGDVGKAMRKDLVEQYNLQPLSWHYIGTRILTSNKPVRNLNDIADLTLRLPYDKVWSLTWSALGANVKSVQFPDLYSALEAKHVEAQENPPNLIRAQRFYEVQKYLVPTNHMPQRQFIFTSSKTYEKLSSENKSIILDSAKEASTWGTMKAKNSQEKDINWLVKEAGMIMLNINLDGIRDKIKSVPAAMSGVDGAQMLSIIENTN